MEAQGPIVSSQLTTINSILDFLNKLGRQLTHPESPSQCLWCLSILGEKRKPVDLAHSGRMSPAGNLGTSAAFLAGPPASPDGVKDPLAP